MHAIIHTLVDLACVTSVYFAVGDHIDLAVASLFILGYDFLAFAMQPFLGALASQEGWWGVISSAGCVMVAIGTALASIPLLCILLCGLGNAAFHVGGGVVALRHRPGEAKYVGLYVAPGAFGLFFGTIFGKWGTVSPFIFTGIMALCAITLMIFGRPTLRKAEPRPQPKRFFLVLSLLFMTVVARALVGTYLPFKWKETFLPGLILVGFVALGKGLGGILGDRFGLKRVGVLALLISAPLLMIGIHTPAVGMVGALFFNCSMALTVTALAMILPGFEGVGFGLTTLALYCGVFPSFFGIFEFMHAWYIVLPLILLSALMYYLGMKGLEER